jgi:hypothetical protein
MSAEGCLLKEHDDVCSRNARTSSQGRLLNDACSWTYAEGCLLKERKDICSRNVSFPTKGMWICLLKEWMTAYTRNDMS